MSYPRTLYGYAGRLTSPSSTANKDNAKREGTRAGHGAPVNAKLSLAPRAPEPLVEAEGFGVRDAHTGELRVSV